MQKTKPPKKQQELNKRKRHGKKKTETKSNGKKKKKKQNRKNSNLEQTEENGTKNGRKQRKQGQKRKKTEENGKKNGEKKKKPKRHRSGGPFCEIPNSSPRPSVKCWFGQLKCQFFLFLFDLFLGLSAGLGLCWVRTASSPFSANKFHAPSSGFKMGILSMSRSGLEVGKKWALTHFDPLLDPKNPLFTPFWTHFRRLTKKAILNPL